MLTGNTLISIPGKESSPVKLSELVQQFQPTDELLVVGCYEKSNRRIKTEILSTRSNSTRDFIYITTSSGDCIKITPTQKIYEGKEKKWKRAMDIAVGDKLLHVDRT